ncbi:TPA: peptidyl-tRNA hydrolase [Candidatus Bathyarchaeota archaeon]|nr:peptidyl-tRNA hydrolase [Candidatus Bathyarchaeota archaeon]
MKLIVGLGNPGRKYRNTRHNVGHLFIDYFSRQEAPLPGAVKALRTSAFMNDSGKEVKSLITNYTLSRQGRLNATDLCFPITNLLIVHDDMDLASGEFKFQLGRGAAGHKGVQSVIDELETRDFWRLRFGVGRPADDTPAEEFVLGDFCDEERPRLEEAFGEALPQVRSWIEGGDCDCE